MRIPTGKYRGWRTYWQPFSDLPWKADKGLESMCAKTNMKLLELLDYREGLVWEPE